MGNRALIEKFKEKPTFLGNNDKGLYWTKLEYFYSKDLNAE